MGTWGDGLLAGDSQLDYLGDVVDSLARAAGSLQEEPTLEETVARLGAYVGLLIQFGTEQFEVGNLIVSDLGAALKKHLRSCGGASLPKRHRV